MPQFAQYVVGDIDDVVDRALTHGVEPALEPLGRRADLNAAHDAADVARAVVWGLDVDPHVLLSRRSAFGDLCVGRAQEAAGECVDLAGNAPEAQAVRAIGRNLEVNDHIVEPSGRGKRGADREVFVEHQNAVVAVAQPELVFGAEHALGCDAADFGFFDLHPSGQRSAGQGDGDGLPGHDIGCAADDGVDPGPHIDLADGQTVGVFVRATDIDAADDDALVARPEIFGSLECQAGHGQPLG